MAGCPWVCLLGQDFGRKKTRMDDLQGSPDRGPGQSVPARTVEQYRTNVCELSRKRWRWRGGWLAVFPLGGWFIHTMKEDEGTGPAEVGKLGGEDFDPVVVGQVVNGAEVGVE